MLDPANTFKACPICGKLKLKHERTVNKIALLKCVACNFIFANIDDKTIHDTNFLHDKKEAARYEAQQSHIDTLWYKRIADELTRHLEKGTVLDVGCGHGLLLKQFMHHQWEAYGLDVAPWAKIFAERYGYTLYLTELEKSDLPDNSFDMVTSTATFEHISYPLNHLKNMLRVLKPGGILYISGVPNYGSLTMKLKIPQELTGNIPPGHVNFFTCESMNYLLSHSELVKDIKSFSIGTYGIPEIYIIYSMIVRRIKNMFKKTQEVESNAISDKEKDLPIIFNKFVQLLLGINYYAGKPFHFGACLEIKILKNN